MVLKDSTLAPVNHIFIVVMLFYIIESPDTFRAFTGWAP